MVRAGSTGWTVEELDLVPCECDFKNPSWGISSSSSTIDTEAERVAITNAVVRVKDVPVLWLPWISLPLSARQSGLLFTRPNFTTQNGFILEQPIFLTLGRSADITLTPGFLTGSPGVGQPGAKGGPSALGVAGPKLGTEFRYMPSSRATGRIVLGLLYDFRDKRDVENPGLRVPLFLTDRSRGLRGEFGWQHTQDFDHGFGMRVDLNAHSDGDYNRDLTVDVIASTATYLRSTASVFHRGADHYVGLDVGLRQDIEWGYDFLGRGPLDASGRPLLLNPARDPNNRYGPGTLQRLPAITFGWAPTQMLGPLRFDVEGDAVRLSPLFSNTGDEGTAAAEGAVQRESFARGVDRLFSPSATSIFGVVRDGIGDRIWQPGEREARDRLMVLPRLSISGQPLGALSASAFAAWRQLAWAGEASGRTWSRGYLVFGGRLETELSRSLGDGSVRHVIQPLAEVRAIPVGVQGASGSLLAPATVAPVAYDAVDAAVPNITPRFQGSLELRQRLVRRDGAELLRLDVGQGFELSGADYTHLTPILGESFGRLGTRLGWFSATGTIRFDLLRPFLPGESPLLNRSISRLAGRADLDDGRHGVYLGYENLLMEGTARSRQPIDLLFLFDRGFNTSTRVQQITFGARWDFGPASLRYDALVSEHVVNSLPVLKLSQHSVGVGFAPACDCWRVDVVASQVVGTDPLTGVMTLLTPNVGFNVSISKFGSIGSR
jgi:LPS-assembly protein